MFEESPIKPVSVGKALNVTLDNYYDLIKAQVGGLKTQEFLQLKLLFFVSQVVA